MVKTRFYHKFEEKLPSVEGKVFVITGTTSGTGFVAAWTAAKHGGEVILLNRKSTRSVDSLAKLKEIVPTGKFVPIECDLQSFESTRKAIAEIKEKYSKIYCLALNAGIMANPEGFTKDGFDVQMQTNHLSHFLLTAELFPLIEAAAEEFNDARIVTHSSLGRFHTPDDKLELRYFLTKDQLEEKGLSLDGNSSKMMTGGNWWRYFQTKLSNSVMTQALHQKLTAKNSKIRSISAHPGGSDTNLADDVSFGCFFGMVLGCLGPFLMQSPEDGAAGLVKAMMDPKAKSGVLYGPKGEGTRGKPIENLPKPFEKDPVSIKLLWDASEEATGIKFDI